MDEKSNKIQLRRYQEEAIEKWIKNDYKGILAMATGSGKTIIAIEAIRKFLIGGKIGLIIIPTKTLLKQWYKEIKKHIPNAFVICCSSDEPKWEKRLEKLINLFLEIKNNENSSLYARPKVIISTMGTAWKESFREYFKNLLDDDVVIVIDEVHRVGAPRYRNILSMPFKRRLGLSATPMRDWDYIGSKKIKEYFNGIIYKYSISDAIRDGYLVPYEYHIETVTLTIDELKNYLEISNKIKKIVKTLLQEYMGLSIKDILSMAEEIGEYDKDMLLSLQNLLVSRRRIIKKCKNKYKVIMDIINKYDRDMRSCLIYCEDYKQLDLTKKLMLNNGLAVGEYTARLDKNQREKVFRAMKAGHIKYLVSCKCLDEGVDIPSCESAILMANSTVEREFIQRRGRVLRLYPNKEKAIIFDLFVVPYENAQNQVPLNDVEKEIILSELKRIMFFAEDAINREEVIRKLNILNHVFKLG